jgi:hypothetical protein
VPRVGTAVSVFTVPVSVSASGNGRESYRAVVEEGQQHFNTSNEALQWLKERSWMPFVYRNDGLVVGWSTTPERHQLNAEVWQFYVQHQKPVSLEGANDAKVTVVRTPGAT